MTAEDCRKRCQENVQCELWVLNSGTCHLKTFGALVSSTENCSHATAGTSLCPGKGFN